MQDVTFSPVGILSSPYTDMQNMPVQSAGSRGRATINLYDDFTAGLQGLEGFSHLILLTYLHKAPAEMLTETPMVDGGEPHGIFATRHMCRPNKIGLSVVRLIAVQGNHVLIEGLDLINETPVLDIKPYIPAFDAVPDASSGWLSAQHIENILTRNNRLSFV